MRYIMPCSLGARGSNGDELNRSSYLSDSSRNPAIGNQSSRYAGKSTAEILEEFGSKRAVVVRSTRFDEAGLDGGTQLAILKMDRTLSAFSTTEDIEWSASKLINTRWRRQTYAEILLAS